MAAIRADNPTLHRLSLVLTNLSTTDVATEVLLL